MDVVIQVELDFESKYPLKCLQDSELATKGSLPPKYIVSRYVYKNHILHAIRRKGTVKWQEFLGIFTCNFTVKPPFTKLYLRI